MGNRAIITSYPFDASNVGVYVHWNGGLASIEGFCQACRELGFRDPQGDSSYGLARLTQAIATFFGRDGLSVGIGRVDELDTENGIYVIGRDWQVVERRGGSAPYPLIRTGDRASDWGRDEVDPAKTARIAAEIVNALRAKQEA